MKISLKNIRPNNCGKLLKYCVSFIAVFLASTAIDIACGPEPDPYDYYISFFHNNLADNNDYKPFNFSGYTFLYDEAEPGSEAAINSAEWATYLGGGIKAADIERAMYGLDRKADSLLQIKYLAGKGSLPDSLRGNSFLIGIRAKQRKDVLAYYRFAKQAERYAAKTDYWDPIPRDTTALARLGNEALKRGEAVTDGFLKLRYFYQGQRLLRYAGEFKPASKIYEQHIAGVKSVSHVKGWALALQAGMEADSVKSAYMFSQVFEKYRERRVQAYRNYNYTNARPEQVLNLAKSDHEKAVIYAINGLGDPHFNVQHLKDIYGCEPASPVVGILLAREVNKLEEAYLDQKVTKGLPPIASPVMSFNGYYDVNAESLSKAALKDFNGLNKFCTQLFNERLNPDYGLGKLVQAYLAWIKNDTKAGQQYLSELNNVKLRSKLQDQKQIINLLLIAQGIQKFDEMDEAAMLPSLKWLDEKVKSERYRVNHIDNYYIWSFYSERPFSASARNFYQTILAPAYYKKGFVAKAAAAMAKGDAPGDKGYYFGSVTLDFWRNYLHPASVSTLIAWRNNPPQNAYLKLLSDGLRLHNDKELYDLLGTTYLRHHQYDKAAAAFKKVGKPYLDSLQTNLIWNNENHGSDPFIDRLADYPKVWLIDNSKGYSKLGFANAMYALQQKMKASPNDPANYYKYATGLYNTGTHGNSWSYISYGWAASDAGRRKEHYYDEDYIQSANAETYYRKARDLSNNAEFKAKCTYMLAKCRQKQINYEDLGEDRYAYEGNNSKYQKALRQNPFFNELKNNYANTKYYKLAVNECSYLRDFLGIKGK
ncbi:hypothetical protein [Mucilaginibacter pedocola]|uniref:Uncharacterized protein n=1 Tax=Mucilaginibacter pedocola TaxID=1792845 RepID=A0A1S9PIT0_9SPHI|nr:hypothetical protein [Mucilaginibacter pedocola]OOQ60854.1 hypothetical protein BC343_23085 [Mucilaginibacter pedocola]